MKIYLAAPVFTQAHRRWNRAFAEALTAAWSESTVLDDQLDVILPQTFRAPEGTDAAAKERFDALGQACIVAIEQADALVTVLEGADADSGVAFEHGFAYARGKPIVGVRTDVRANRVHGLNIMLDHTCRRYVYRRAFDERIEPLAKAVVKALRDASGL